MKKKSKALIREAFSIEYFYDLKHKIELVNDRYEYNLKRLPQPPEEMPSLSCAIEVLDNCRQGIPFTAIEFIHNDTTPEATSAVIKALHNHSDHQYCWADCETTPLWYALAAEGHVAVELIDPVIAFYTGNDTSHDDWLLEQGQYLIGKLAQKFPEITTQKVMEAMEKDAAHGGNGSLFFLFDVFAFCHIDFYKDRLTALLKLEGIVWYDLLVSTIGYLQVKEALPVLKGRLKQIEGKEQDKNFPNNYSIIEIKDTIKELESGESDTDPPLCITRDTWREEFADAEKYFYDDDNNNYENRGYPDYLNINQAVQHPATGDQRK